MEPVKCLNSFFQEQQNLWYKRHLENLQKLKQDKVNQKEGDGSVPLSTLVEQVSAAPPLPSSEPTKGKPPPPPPKEEPPAPPLPPEEAKVIKYNEDVVICSHLKLNFVLTRMLPMRTGFPSFV